MEKQTYDPSKKYTWTPTDSFTFSGEEFGLIINTIRSILSTPRANEILMAARVNDILDKTMALAVEAGTVVEVASDVTDKKVQELSMKIAE